MPNDASRPNISLTPESWPPAFLAAGFAVGVAYVNPEAAAAGARSLVEDLTGHLRGIWHVEAHDSIYLSGQLPAQRYHGPAGLTIGFTPILADPADEAARGLASEALAGLLTSLGSCPDAVRLIDWALTPTRRALGLMNQWFEPSDPALFAARADAYATLRQARAAWLTPWIAGDRRVRNLDAFRALHVEMTADEALLAAIIWGRGSVWERRIPAGRLATAINGLVDKGWIERSKSPYSKDITLSKTRRFAHRFPQVEALAY
jgi:hypothetical protein